ncbi:4-amino-4-deoxy-L-arabinose transferase-like glycosyltransferase [Mycolicibacterium sp. BK556]|uniref:glycosyltransferase family 39 protein n=1 Tax=Mycobacteriaceae TaxID=1762 RepID=UPI00105E2DDF|nr:MULTISPECIES: glycosyltransferase family 39 protein [Mycobacteriaceae]MBB3601361.1 4-amino-4-deoxy-L-arabinose transferase-like glycosyltransferase [Mycolicibacterium sp. BK556]MBB3631113.1 4-amino-4-deoxy-L-arabinose transferase-like glycosyltransferase [Mycolicibacterium sp. BK607]TDO14675.1 4-amino-4-deoxy-L-arabinose transferase-like glycosyltransferase [Mycobacterium sp. BK086]
MIRARHYGGLAVLLLATAVLYIWNLGASGWANAFYSAAAQAGSESWTAWLFGSSDAANAITVDKTPAALWVTGLSARLFGVNSWSILLPQAVAGVAAVAVLYVAVRRVSGPWAGLFAGAVLALTPAAALMFRFNNPDALLVLSLVVAAYFTQRSLDRDAAWWWLPLAGVAVGVGFLAKMLQAFLVLPALAGVFLLAADVTLRSRLVRLLAAVGALVVSAGWYLALVALWPASARPYIGGSQHNSIVELALGYNGLGRLTGDETGGLGNLNQEAGWARLFGGEMGTYIAWLVPAAIIAVIAGLVITRRAPRTDVTRAALLLWGGWLVVTAVVFSYANGILHSYYTVALAPAIGGGLAIGTTLLWRRRADIRAATTLSGMIAITAVLAYVLLQRDSQWLPWLRVAIAVVSIGCALLLLVVGRLPRRVGVAVGTAALIAALGGPVAFTLATVAAPHSGAMPSVGPANGRGGPPGGMFDAPTPGAELTTALKQDADQFTWVAAAVGSSNAAGYQLATGLPVMAVGGFNGTDPAPTLEQFQSYVAQRRVHWFVRSEMPGFMFGNRSGSDAAERIQSWVRANFTSREVDGVTVYDLSQGFIAAT